MRQTDNPRFMVFQKGFTKPCQFPFCHWPIPFHWLSLPVICFVSQIPFHFSQLHLGLRPSKSCQEDSWRMKFYVSSTTILRGVACPSPLWNVSQEGIPVSEVEHIGPKHQVNSSNVIIFQWEFRSKDAKEQSSKEFRGKGEISGGKTKIENVLVQNWNSSVRVKNDSKNGIVLLESGCFDFCLNPLIIQVLLNILGLSQIRWPFSHQMAHYFSAPSTHRCSHTTCWVHWRDLPNAALFPWDNLGAYVGFCWSVCLT